MATSELNASASATAASSSERSRDTAPALRGGTSSRVRERAHSEHTRGVRRVAEYLRVLGLCDEARVQQLAEQLSAEAAGDNAEGARAEDAVAHAQARIEAFFRAVFEAEVESIDALWLRAFVGARPELLLADPTVARIAAEQFGDRREGRTPALASFVEQRFIRTSLPRWLRGLVPPLALTVLCTSVLLLEIARDGLSAAALAWVALFAFLFGLSAQSTWLALIGFSRLRQDARAAASAAPSVAVELPRTALLMPIYHEDAERVFAGLLAMRESLLGVPGGEVFELFVLSDSQDPGKSAEEERAFRRAAAIAGKHVPLYYRRRARNDRKKAGNLAEFFERFGPRYTYAVVLDADSLMSGESLVELVRRMEAAPRVGLLQAPLALHGGETLFARAQQLAASVSGPLLLRGLVDWSGPHGNYYGHNAIVRVRAFLECCALPVLAGEPPLGGQLLSHDFVEAALLCRAGYEVRGAHDLGGSFEELPQSLPAYVARDRRWCQGNIQHLRVAFAEGLQPMSRLHLLLGAAAYLVGPAWLAFVLLGVLLASGRAQGALPGGAVALALTGVSIAMLLSSRALGLFALLRDPVRRAAHGGFLRACAGAAGELLLSGLLAPLFMLHHTRCVLSIVFGHSVSWGEQARGAVAALRAIIRSELPATLLGVAAALGLWSFAPELLWWLAPVWLPLACAIPIAALASSATAGRLLARMGLLLVPSETQPDELVSRVAELRALTLADGAARFRDLVLDPVLLASHLRKLAGRERARDEQRELQLAQLCERALRVGPAALTPEERDALCGHGASMRRLHREAWRKWPVESWQLAREQPYLPPNENELRAAE